MSTEASTWVRDNVPSSDPTLKSLLMYLASYHNPHSGKLRPSWQRLQQDSGYSKPTIWRKLKIAEARGWITIERSGDRVNTSQYAVNWDCVMIVNPNYKPPEVVSEVNHLPTEVVTQGNQGGYTGKPGVVSEVNHITKEENQIESQSKTLSGYTEDFEQWWAVWRKTGRGKAKAAAFAEWTKLNNQRPPLPDLIADVEIRLAQDWDWIKDEGQFIPWAQRYLKNRRWEDDVTPQPLGVDRYGDKVSKIERQSRLADQRCAEEAALEILGASTAGEGADRRRKALTADYSELPF